MMCKLGWQLLLNTIYFDSHWSMDDANLCFWIFFYIIKSHFRMKFIVLSTWMLHKVWLRLRLIYLKFPMWHTILRKQRILHLVPILMTIAFLLYWSLRIWTMIDIKCIVFLKKINQTFICTSKCWVQLKCSFDTVLGTYHLSIHSFIVCFSVCCLSVDQITQK